jgi:hypothetical protein
MLLIKKQRKKDERIEMQTCLRKRPILYMKREMGRPFR